MYGYRKNTANQTLGFALTSCCGAVTEASVSVYRSIDGGTQAAATGTVTERGNGQYILSMSQADTNGDAVSFLFTAPHAIPVEKTIVTGVGEAEEPDFASVSLLLHGDGADGSATIVDNSSYGRTPTVVGNTKNNTAQAKYGAGSIRFDGVGDYLDYADHVDFEMGSADFTVEMFIRFNAVPTSGNAALLAQKYGGGGNEFQLFVHGTAGKLNLTVYGSSTASLTGTTVFATGIWYHVAFTRSGSSLRLFVNGVAEDTNTLSGNVAGGTSPLRLGADAGGTDAFNGWMDEVRITKGFARYTTNFTPPAAAFPNS